MEIGAHGLHGATNVSRKEYEFVMTLFRQEVGLHVRALLRKEKPAIPNCAKVNDKEHICISLCIK